MRSVPRKVRDRKMTRMSYPASDKTEQRGLRDEREPGEGAGPSPGVGRGAGQSQGMLELRERLK